MTEKVQAAYRLLNSANDRFVEAFKVLAEGLEYQKQAFELLRLREMLKLIAPDSPSQVPASPVSPITQQSKTGCKVEVALWQKAKGFSGFVTVKEAGQEAKFRFVLFEYTKDKQPNLRYNGSIVPKDSPREVSLMEAQIGGLFIYHKPENGSFVVTGRFEAGHLNNEISFSGSVEGVNRLDDKYPHLRANCQTAERFFKDNALAMLPSSNSIEAGMQTMQQMSSSSLLSGLMSAPGQPADPIVTPIPPVPPAGTPDDLAMLISDPAGTQMLDQPSVDDISKLLG